MTDALRLVLALVTGLLLGAIFFGGLWWTVRKGFSSKQPALWFVSSLLLRMVLSCLVSTLSRSGAGSGFLRVFLDLSLRALL